jgi:hypothetical protein
MPDAIAAPQTAPEAIHPPAISLSEIWPWAIFGLSLLALMFFVGVDEGAASLTSGQSVHEWVHDGRHLLGFPCH